MKRPRTRHPGVWALGAALLLAGGYFGFHALFVKVSRTVQMPFTGPASYDDFYVLRAYLQERGLEAKSVRSWPQPLTPDTAVLWFTDDPMPPPLREWLSGGGRVWSFGDPDVAEDDAAYDWMASDWDPGPTTDGGVDADLNAATEPPTLDAPLDAGVPEDVSAAGAAGDAGVATSDEVYLSCEQQPDGCLYAAQYDYGTGCLTLVGRHGLENDQLPLGRTAERVDALLRCPSAARRVLIVSSAGSPWFGSLLLAHTPHALVSALVLLLLWLWRASRHFGPIHPPRPRERRRLLEHIVAVGTLASRAGTGTLIAAARRELRQRLLRRIPGGQQLQGAALVAAVASRHQCAVEDVNRALLETPTGAPDHTLAIARSIHALWRQS